MRFDLPPSVGRWQPDDRQSVWALLDVLRQKAYAVLDEPKKAIVFDFGKMGDDFKQAKSGGHGSSSSSAGGPARSAAEDREDRQMDARSRATTARSGRFTEDKPKEKKKKRSSVPWPRTSPGSICTSWVIGTVDPKLAVMMELGDLNHFPLRFIARRTAPETPRGWKATKVEKKTLGRRAPRGAGGVQVVTLDQMIAGFMRRGWARASMPGVPPHRSAASVTWARGR